MDDISHAIGQVFSSYCKIEWSFVMFLVLISCHSERQWLLCTLGESVKGVLLLLDYPIWTVFHRLYEG